jgi:nucleotide-binding universal stress UspA family protein
LQREAHRQARHQAHRQARHQAHRQARHQAHHEARHQAHHIFFKQGEEKAMSEAIVVGTDGSETAQRAVLEAARMAKALDAELHVVTACKPVSRSLGGVPDPGAYVLATMPESEAQPIAEQAASGARGEGISVHTHVHASDPSSALVSVAASVGAKTIVVGNRGMSGARRLLGSVADRVSHTARCNVLIVSTGKRRGA